MISHLLGTALNLYLLVYFLWVKRDNNIQEQKKTELHKKMSDFRSLQDFPFPNPPLYGAKYVAQQTSF